MCKFRWVQILSKHSSSDRSSRLGTNKKKKTIQDISIDLCVLTMNNAWNADSIRKKITCKSNIYTLDHLKSLMDCGYFNTKQLFVDKMRLLLTRLSILPSTSPQNRRQTHILVSRSRFIPLGHRQDDSR